MYPLCLSMTDDLKKKKKKFSIKRDRTSRNKARLPLRQLGGGGGEEEDDETFSSRFFSLFRSWKNRLTLRGLIV